MHDKIKENRGEFAENREKPPSKGEAARDTAGCVSGKTHDSTDAAYGKIKAKICKNSGGTAMRASGEYDTGSFVGRSRKTSILILLCLFAVGTVLTLSGRQGAVTAQVDEEKLGVVGSCGEPVFVPLADIHGIALIDALDAGTAVDAEESGNTMCGLYENEAYGQYELRIYTKGGPYVAVTYRDGQTLVFCLSTGRQTQKVYDELTDGWGG